MQVTAEKYKHSQEIISSVIFYRELQRQKKQLINFLLLYNQKSFKDDFNAFIDKVLTPFAYIVSRKSKQVLTAWFNSWKKQFKKKTENININWGLKNDEATIYINNLTDLHLSQRNWSISRTTKLWIIELLRDWVNEWLSYWEIAKWIRLKDPVVFSKSRAELIAVQEVGRAYEYWNYLPMKELVNKWEQVKKKWITAWDEKVRPAHRQNWNDWWIDMKLPFSWTKTNIAPQGFRCRCSTAYLVE